MAEPPFGFHVHSMPGAREKSGCKEPRDDASVLDGEAERATPLGVAGVAQFRIARRASVSLDEPQTLVWDDEERSGVFDHGTCFGGDSGSARLCDCDACHSSQPPDLRRLRTPWPIPPTSTRLKGVVGN